MLAAASLFVTIGCSPPAPAPPPTAPGPDLAAEEKALRDLDARWLRAVQSRDAAQEAALFASDGVAYREHVDPLVGPAAYQAYVTKFQADNPKANITWTTDGFEFAASGDLAIQTGAVHSTGLGPNGVAEDRARYVTAWKKVGGEWKVAHDISLTTMPQTPPDKR
jgi:uncharacterized protein (TIGR02246 family)